MLKSKELRAKAWNSLKDKYWMAFIVVIVSGLLVSIGTGLVSAAQSILISSPVRQARVSEAHTSATIWLGL